MAENLICAETTETWLNENDHDIHARDFVNEIDYNHKVLSKDETFDTNKSIPLMGFPVMLGEDCIREMVERESDFLPGDDYIERLRAGDSELCFRKEALHWIWKACAHHSFGPLCLYLSANYIDRFLSSYELPKDRTWTVQLLAVACLSLAAKIEETDVPQSIDLQVGDPKFVFEAKTIQRMELLVLNTLNWRLHMLTPFSFIDYFLSKISNQPEDSISGSIQLILDTIKGIEFLDFRPSEIAAAAAVAVSISGEMKTGDDEKAISSFIHVKIERVMKCLRIIRSLSAEKGSAAPLQSPQPPLTTVLPGSPIGVLEATCLSYKSDDRTVGSWTNSSHCSTDNNNTTKRRKQ